MRAARFGRAPSREPPYALAALVGTRAWGQRTSCGAAVGGATCATVPVNGNGPSSHTSDQVGLGCASLIGSGFGGPAGGSASERAGQRPARGSAGTGRGVAGGWRAPGGGPTRGTRHARSWRLSTA